MFIEIWRKLSPGWPKKGKNNMENECVLRYLGKKYFALKKKLPPHLNGLACDLTRRSYGVLSFIWLICALRLS